MNQGGHILIIDDEASLRQTMARILLRAGFEVTTVATGSESFTVLNEHPFDLIYLDIRLPDMNGLEILKTIRAQFPELHPLRQVHPAQLAVHPFVGELHADAFSFSVPR